MTYGPETAAAAPRDRPPALTADQREFLKSCGSSLADESAPELLVVDNFYAYPEVVSNFAVESCAYAAQPDQFKGYRSSVRFLFPGVKERVEKLLGLNIPDWEKHGFNGVFQRTSKGDPLVYHSDSQDWAGAVYLSRDHRVDCGTSFWRSRKTNLRHAPTEANRKSSAYPDLPLAELERMQYLGNLTDPANWELVDKIGSVYNRLVLWNARLVHSASGYSGEALDRGDRLVQLFFFDAVRPAY